MQSDGSSPEAKSSIAASRVVLRRAIGSWGTVIECQSFKCDNRKKREREREREIEEKRRGKRKDKEALESVRKSTRASLHERRKE